MLPPSDAPPETALLDAMGAAVMVIDADRRVTHLTPAWQALYPAIDCERLLGRPLSEALARLLALCADARDTENTATEAAAWADEVEHTPCVRELKLQDDRTLRIKHAPASDGSRLGIHEDISELAQIRSQLRESEDRFRDIMESFADWYWESGPDHRFTYVGRPIEQHTRIDPALYKGIGRWEVDGNDAPPDSEFWARHLADLAAHRAFRNLRFSRVRADGERRHFCVDGKPVFDTEGHFVGYRGVGRDITEHVRLEEQLRQRQRMEALGQLTGGVAHDFNNLLAIISGNLELVEAELAPSSELTDFVHVALASTDRGAALTRSLLAFSRQQTLTPNKVNVNALVDELSVLLRRTLPENIDLRVVHGKHRPHCWADGGLLQSAILNLVLNARDAMPGGGEVSVSISSTTLDAPVDVDSGPSAGQYVEVCVTDSGVGMTPELKAQAFDPYFTSKSRAQSSGLGLSMVYGFVTQSGGHIDVQSEVGRGTRVRILLPASEPEAAPSRPAAPVASPGAIAARVLVIEDDPDLLDMVRRLLRAEGYDVISASNATEGLLMLDRHADLSAMLTDIVLAGSIDGIALARQARHKIPGLPIVFMSGYLETSAQQEEYASLSARFLHKPFKREDLSRMMREALTVQDETTA